LVKEIIRNLLKDFVIEFRNRYSLYVAIAFSGITTISISLVSGGVPFPTIIQSIILWIIIFFSAINGLLHVFIREEDQGTALFLRMNSSPDSIFLSKLIFNILFFLIILLTVVPLYLFFLQVNVLFPLYFILTILIGGVTISASTTILAALVSKAGGKGSLFTVISFPILLPVLWVSISSTNSTLVKTGRMNYGNLIFLLAFSGLIISISLLLFRSIWDSE